MILAQNDLKTAVKVIVTVPLSEPARFNIEEWQQIDAY